MVLRAKLKILLVNSVIIEFVPPAYRVCSVRFGCTRTLGLIQHRFEGYRFPTVPQLLPLSPFLNLLSA